MSVIPFGVVGAVWGHLIMRMDLTILSMFGVVALAGVVVNDSIVLVHYINRRRAAGVPVEQAVRDAGVARFRAILLTSVTTFAGLSPLLFARSVQAKFMVPMAVSLGFGVMFATFITLMMVPVSYLILEDVKSLAARVFGRRIEGPEPMETPAVPTMSSGGQP
jgi:multidrug efflux pump subunit AcrB